MHMDTALALMEEMRSRNIQPNTHTYSSLLNVCVKAGQLNMALGVYNEVSGRGSISSWLWLWHACLAMISSASAR